MTPIFGFRHTFFGDVLNFALAEAEIVGADFKKIGANFSTAGVDFAIEIIAAGSLRHCHISLGGTAWCRAVPLVSMNRTIGATQYHALALLVSINRTTGAARYLAA
uniref:Uncharacterized protein n=1 Tax=Romanomermis culicivorax TaxID=13658 RepID=A0A915L725_ROMCU